MTQFTFVSTSKDNNCNRVYQDFHASVSNIHFNKDGTFTVTASDDYLERVFTRPESDGSGLCQKYKIVS